MAKRYAGFLGLQPNMDPPGFGSNRDGNIQGSEVLPGIYAADGGGRSATGGRGGQKPKTASSSIGARGTAASSPPPTGKSARLQADAAFRSKARQDASDRRKDKAAKEVAAAAATSVRATEVAAPKRRIPI